MAFLPPPALPFAAGVLVVGPYVFDVAWTLVRRARERKPLGQAHKEHLYQRLSRGLGSHVRSALVFGALTAATSALALAYDGLGDLGRALALLLPPVVLLLPVPWILRTESAASAASARSPEDTPSTR